MSKYYRRYTRRLRNGHVVPIGLIIANLNEKNMTIGWALCHKNDQFNRKTAAAMCLGRLETAPIDIDILNEDSINEAFASIPETLHESAAETLAYAYRRFLKGPNV